AASIAHGPLLNAVPPSALASTPDAASASPSAPPAAASFRFPYSRSSQSSPHPQKNPPTRSPVDSQLRHHRGRPLPIGSPLGRRLRSEPASLPARALVHTVETTPAHRRARSGSAAPSLLFAPPSRSSETAPLPCQRFPWSCPHDPAARQGIP